MGRASIGPQGLPNTGIRALSSRAAGLPVFPQATGNAHLLCVLATLTREKHNYCSFVYYYSQVAKGTPGCE